MKKILIVEDERILAEMYQKKLEMEGFEVFLAENAKEGLEIAKEKKPDLVLLDILLPGESGLFFLKELKKDAKLSKIPVFAFSNYEDQKTREKSRSLGAEEYLIKTNYTPAEVIEKIKKYLKE